jgi:hypothetical protein
VVVFVKDAAEELHAFLSQLLIYDIYFIIINFSLFRSSVKRLAKGWLDKEYNLPYIKFGHYLLGFLSYNFIIIFIDDFFLNKFGCFFEPSLLFVSFLVPFVPCEFRCGAPLVKPIFDRLSDTPKELFVTDVHFAF